jgi:hypothetical protein
MGLSAAIAFPLAPYVFKGPTPPPAPDPIDLATRDWTWVVKVPTLQDITGSHVRGPNFIACLVKVADSSTFFASHERGLFPTDHPIGIWQYRKGDQGWVQSGDFRIADPGNFLKTGKDGALAWADLSELPPYLGVIEMNEMRQLIQPDGDAKQELDDGFSLRVVGGAPSGVNKHPEQTLEWHQGGTKWSLSNDSVRKLRDGGSAEGYTLHRADWSDQMRGHRESALEQMRSTLKDSVLTTLPDGRRRLTHGGDLFEEQFIDSPIWRCGTRVLIDETESGEPDDDGLQTWLGERTNVQEIEE